MTKVTKVIRRDCDISDFNSEKIEKAILKAMKRGSGSTSYNKAKEIALEIEQEVQNIDEISIYDIEKMVVNKLIKHGEEQTALSYEGYRKVREFQRKENTTDDDIIGIVNGNNKETINENSNKDAKINSTVRDLIAGEVSKDIYRRKHMPLHVVQAHDEGILHVHDCDYLLQRENNCGLVNIQDMLDNGTVINGKTIESPNSFQVACTVMTQIIAQVASSQYGGQSVNIKHLGKYLRKSKERWYKIFGETISGDDLDRVVDVATRKELESGVQTIQYQINTLQTSNGQTPFITLFLELDKNDEYIDEVAEIIAEILRQRIVGIKNKQGIFTTPTFPKLVYVLDEHNCLEGGKYDWVTEIACKCTAKRIYPDYISAKEMRKNYDGQVFSCMGCRSFLSPWKNENGQYQFEGRFNMGVVTLNLPRVALDSGKSMNKFWNLLDQRLELCYDALMSRVKYLKGTTSDVAPILWQHGAYARLEQGETIDKLMFNGYATMSLGYIGIYEMTKYMTGEDQTGVDGRMFALDVMIHLNETITRWKKETGIAFGLYGSPAESTCYTFARKDKARYGNVEDITDKNYYTNSYHIDVRRGLDDGMDAFTKLKIESEFQKLSLGGAISYVEVPNMSNNIDAIKAIVNYIYHNIQYAELNGKSDYCMCCGYDGEIMINDNLEWECPNCHNKEQEKMEVIRRTCGLDN